MQFVYDVLEYCPGTFDIWSKMALKHIKTNQEHRTNGAPGEAQIGPRGAPQRFRKTSLENKMRHDVKVSSKSFQNGPPNVRVCGFVCVILLNVFQHHIEDFLYRFSNGFGIDLTIILMTCLEIFGYCFETCRLG